MLIHVSGCEVSTCIRKCRSRASVNDRGRLPLLPLSFPSTQEARNWHGRPRHARPKFLSLLAARFEASFILPVFARHLVPLENMAVGTRHTRIRHAARRTSFTRKRLPCQTMSARMNIAHLGNVRNE
jgi:hypothetical protein